MTDPADKLADVAEDAIKRADAAEAKLKNPQELRARLAQAEAKKAAEAKRQIRELIAADPAGFNRAVDERNPELLKLLGAMGGAR